MPGLDAPAIGRVATQDPRAAAVRIRVLADGDGRIVTALGSADGHAVLTPAGGVSPE